MHYSLRKAARRFALSYSNCMLKSHGGLGVFIKYINISTKSPEESVNISNVTGFYGQIKDAYMSLQNVWSGTTYRQSPDRM